MRVRKRWVLAAWLCWAVLPLRGLSSPVEIDVASIRDDLEIIEGIAWCRAPPLCDSRGDCGRCLRAQHSHATQPQTEFHR
ncbi:MAG: hypothetical protein RL412_1260 [Pseudomonadota bacterium]